MAISRDEGRRPVRPLRASQRPKVDRKPPKPASNLGQAKDASLRALRTRQASLLAAKLESFLGKSEEPEQRPKPEEKARKPEPESGSNHMVRKGEPKLTSTVEKHSETLADIAEEAALDAAADADGPEETPEPTRTAKPEQKAPAPKVDIQAMLDAQEMEDLQNDEHEAELEDEMLEEMAEEVLEELGQEMAEEKVTEKEDKEKEKDQKKKKKEEEEEEEEEDTEAPQVHGIQGTRRTDSLTRTPVVAPSRQLDPLEANRLKAKEREPVTRVSDKVAITTPKVKSVASETEAKPRSTKGEKPPEAPKAGTAAVDSTEVSQEQVLTVNESAQIESIETDTSVHETQTQLAQVEELPEAPKAGADKATVAPQQAEVQTKTASHHQSTASAQTQTEPTQSSQEPILEARVSNQVAVAEDAPVAPKAGADKATIAPIVAKQTSPDAKENTGEQTQEPTVAPLPTEPVETHPENLDLTDNSRPHPASAKSQRPLTEAHAGESAPVESTENSREPIPKGETPDQVPVAEDAPVATKAGADKATIAPTVAKQTSTDAKEQIQEPIAEPTVLKAEKPRTREAHANEPIQTESVATDTPVAVAKPQPTQAEQLPEAPETGANKAGIAPQHAEQTTTASPASAQAQNEPAQAPQEPILEAKVPNQVPVAEELPATKQTPTTAEEIGQDKIHKPLTEPAVPRADKLATAPPVTEHVEPQAKDLDPAHSKSKPQPAKETPAHAESIEGPKESVPDAKVSKQISVNEEAPVASKAGADKATITPIAAKPAPTATKELHKPLAGPAARADKLAVETQPKELELAADKLSTSHQASAKSELPSEARPHGQAQVDPPETPQEPIKSRVDKATILPTATEQTPTTVKEIGREKIHKPLTEPAVPRADKFAAAPPVAEHVEPQAKDLDPAHSKSKPQPGKETPTHAESIEGPKESVPDAKVSKQISVNEEAPVAPKAGADKTTITPIAAKPAPTATKEVHKPLAGPAARADKLAVETRPKELELAADKLSTPHQAGAKSVLPSEARPHVQAQVEPPETPQEPIKSRVDKTTILPTATEQTPTTLKEIGQERVHEPLTEPAVPRPVAEHVETQPKDLDPANRKSKPQPAKETPTHAESTEGSKESVPDTKISKQVPVGEKSVSKPTPTGDLEGPVVPRAGADKATIAPGNEFNRSSGQALSSSPIELLSQASHTSTSKSQLDQGGSYKQSSQTQLPLPSDDIKGQTFAQPAGGASRAHPSDPVTNRASQTAPTTPAKNQPAESKEVHSPPRLGPTAPSKEMVEDSQVKPDGGTAIAGEMDEPAILPSGTDEATILPTATKQTPTTAKEIGQDKIHKPLNEPAVPRADKLAAAPPATEHVEPQAKDLDPANSKSKPQPAKETPTHAESTEGSKESVPDTKISKQVPVNEEASVAPSAGADKATIAPETVESFRAPGGEKSVSKPTPTGDLEGPGVPKAGADKATIAPGNEFTRSSGQVLSSSPIELLSQASHTSTSKNQLDQGQGAPTNAAFSTPAESTAQPLAGQSNVGQTTHKSHNLSAQSNQQNIHSQANQLSSNLGETKGNKPAATRPVHHETDQDQSSQVNAALSAHGGREGQPVSGQPNVGQTTQNLSAQSNQQNISSKANQLSSDLGGTKGNKPAATRPVQHETDHDHGSPANAAFSAQSNQQNLSSRTSQPSPTQGGIKGQPELDEPVIPRIGADKATIAPGSQHAHHDIEDANLGQGPLANAAFSAPAGSKAQPLAGQSNVGQTTQQSHNLSAQSNQQNISSQTNQLSSTLGETKGNKPASSRPVHHETDHDHGSLANAAFSAQGGGKGQPVSGQPNVGHTSHQGHNISAQSNQQNFSSQTNQPSSAQGGIKGQPELHEPSIPRAGADKATIALGSQHTHPDIENKTHDQGSPANAALSAPARSKAQSFAGQTTHKSHNLSAQSTQQNFSSQANQLSSNLGETKGNKPAGRRPVHHETDHDHGSPANSAFSAQAGSKAQPLAGQGNVGQTTQNLSAQSNQQNISSQSNQPSSAQSDMKGQPELDEPVIPRTGSDKATIAPGSQQTHHDIEEPNHDQNLQANAAFATHGGGKDQPLSGQSNTGHTSHQSHNLSAQSNQQNFGAQANQLSSNLGETIGNKPAATRPVHHETDHGSPANAAVSAQGSQVQPLSGQPSVAHTSHQGHNVSAQSNQQNINSQSNQPSSAQSDMKGQPELDEPVIPRTGSDKATIAPGSQHTHRDIKDTNLGQGALANAAFSAPAGSKAQPLAGPGNVGQTSQNLSAQSNQQNISSQANQLSSSFGETKGNKPAATRPVHHETDHDHGSPANAAVSAQGSQVQPLSGRPNVAHTSHQSHNVSAQSNQQNISSQSNQPSSAQSDMKGQPELDEPVIPRTGSDKATIAPGSQQTHHDIEETNHDQNLQANAAFAAHGGGKDEPVGGQSNVAHTSHQSHNLSAQSSQHPESLLGQPNSKSRGAQTDQPASTQSSAGKRAGEPAAKPTAGLDFDIPLPTEAPKAKSGRESNPPVSPTASTPTPRADVLSPKTSSKEPELSIPLPDAPKPQKPVPKDEKIVWQATPKASKPEPKERVLFQARPSKKTSKPQKRGAETQSLFERTPVRHQKTERVEQEKKIVWSKETKARLENTAEEIELSELLTVEEKIVHSTLTGLVPSTIKLQSVFMADDSPRVFAEVVQQEVRGHSVSLTRMQRNFKELTGRELVLKRASRRSQEATKPTPTPRPVPRQPVPILQEEEVLGPLEPSLEGELSAIPAQRTGPAQTSPTGVPKGPHQPVVAAPTEEATEAAAAANLSLQAQLASEIKIDPKVGLIEDIKAPNRSKPKKSTGGGTGRRRQTTGGGERDEETETEVEKQKRATEEGKTQSQRALRPDEVPKERPLEQVRVGFEKETEQDKEGQQQGRGTCSACGTELPETQMSSCPICAQAGPDVIAMTKVNYRFAGSKFLAAADSFRATERARELLEEGVESIVSLRYQQKIPGHKDLLKFKAKA